MYKKEQAFFAFHFLIRTAPGNVGKIFPFFQAGFPVRIQKETGFSLPFTFLYAGLREMLEKIFPFLALL